MLFDLGHQVLFWFVELAKLFEDFSLALPQHCTVVFAFGLKSLEYGVCDLSDYLLLLLTTFANGFWTTLAS